MLRDNSVLLLRGETNTATQRATISKWKEDEK